MPVGQAEIHCVPPSLLRCSLAARQNRARHGGNVMPLHSRICDMLGIRHPILLAGMGRAATPELAAAVSNAGGLGVIGAASCGPNQLRGWIRRTRELTDKPFGVDTLLPASVRRGGNANAGVS